MDAHSEANDRRRQQAWEIHKEVVTTIHARLQLMVVTNSLLAAGYFVAMNSSLLMLQKVLFLCAICIIAVLFAVAFFIVTRRLVARDNYLRRTFLMQEGDVYREYYFAGGGIRAPKEPRGLFAQFVPTAFILVWIALFGLAIAVVP